MFNVSISIDNASVSSTANSMEDVWALMVPALMAAGFDLEVQIIYSLHDFVEKSGEFYVTSKEDFDNIMAGVKKDGFEEGKATADEQWWDGYNAGLYNAKSSSEECEGQSLCGND